MTKTNTTARIAEFAASVRSKLKGLSAAEIAELTEGLEADLSAQASEQGTAFTLPDPAAYATELRAAAGLASGEKRSPFAWLDTLGSRVLRYIVQRPTFNTIFEFFRLFQPIWWLGRAYFAFIIVDTFLFKGNGFIPGGIAEWCVLVVFAFVSVQLGRGAFRLNTAMKRTVVSLNLFAIAITPLLGYGLLLTARDMVIAYQQPPMDWQPTQGLKLNGTQVDNIFVYDENGKPLKDVQLFMQNGDPLTTVYNTEDGYPWFQNGEDQYVYIKSQRMAGNDGWNVFPLKAIPGASYTEYETGGSIDSAVVDVPLPFPNATPLLSVVGK